MPKSKIFIDGNWVFPEEAKISVFDHALLYGDGIFEGIRAYDGHIFRLSEHLDRLFRSASKIGLTLPKTKAELEKIAKESLGLNNLKNAYIRLIVTRGIGDLGLDPRACGTPSVILIAGQIALFPEKCYREGLEAVFVNTRRNLTSAVDPSIKSLNYLNSILAKIEANEKNVPEGIMLNNDGYVAECSGDNVFFVKGDTIVTPPTSAGILEGITRAAVIDIVKNKTKYRIKEILFTADEMILADEVFFTGTAAEIIPVTKIDNRAIGTGKPGPITLELIHLFRDLVQSEIKEAAFATR
ncbi:MAG: branched-chain-amino-acid transaminase [Elusimicrobia bacterium]|nr:branched-chain-amino-acid transaminase [Candidatus Obscuribacterium magneticum]